MTPAEANRFIYDLCRRAPVIPVLEVEDPANAEPLAQALVAGGLPVLEVTLRTECALTVIGRMAQVPGAVVGAGTLLTPEDVAQARDAGAAFGVSPGSTEPLITACAANSLPLLPGAATPSEVLSLRQQGYRVLKLFPAAVLGGPALLTALAGPFPDVLFCPTGGIGADTARDYLDLSNTICVGGSWVAPRELVLTKNWQAIARLARAAADLARGQTV